MRRSPAPRCPQLRAEHLPASLHPSVPRDGPRWELPLRGRFHAAQLTIRHPRRVASARQWDAPSARVCESATCTRPKFWTHGEVIRDVRLYCDAARKEMLVFGLGL